MRWIVYILTTLTLLSSCRKILFEPDMASTDPYINFDYLWNEVDSKYAYFELKGVDWDKIKEIYRIKLYRGMSEDSLFNVMGGMLNELRDDHTNLVSPFNISRYNVYLKGQDNFDYRVIKDNYLKEGEYTTESFRHGFLPGGKIGYIRYGSFMNSVTDSDLDFILNRYRNTSGIILDLRENGGGSFSNITKILARLTPVKTLVMYNRTRNGKGRDEFGPYEPFYINPSNKTNYTNMPIVVLTDRGSYSASTFFALATKAISGITLIGDKTGGGGGLPNGGQLPNGWIYRFSISQSYDLKKVNYSEEGVEPDIFAEFNWWNLKRDEILDRAMLFINNYGT
jgi:C-terminal processing protease CtpA/Prc